MLTDEPPATSAGTSEEFFADLYLPVFRFIADATGSPTSEVEDLAQETLLQAWRDRHHYGGRSSFLTWVLAIARNRVRDAGRQTQRGASAQVVVRALRRIDVEPFPEDLLLDREVGSRVRRALRALPEPVAHLLSLRHVEGRSVRAIAEELGETEKAVEGRLSRARQAFRDLLKREE